MGVRGPAVGLELVPQVPHVSPGEVEGEAGGTGGVAGAAFQGVEDGAGFRRDTRGGAYADSLVADVVGEHLGGGALGRAEEGEAGRPLRAGAVQPERVLGVGVQVDEGVLGVHGPVDLRDVEGCGLGPDRGRRRGGRGAGGATSSVRAGQVEEAGDQFRPVLAGDRLLVELESPSGQVAVFQGHDHPVLGPGGRPQGVGKGFGDRQRVVAHGGEVLGHFGEEPGAGVADTAQVTVAGFGGRIDPRPGQVRDGLVAQTDPQDGEVQAAQQLGDPPQVAGDGGMSGARGHHDRVHRGGVEPLPFRGVVGEHARLLAQDAGQEVVNVEGVAVVVVHEEDAHSAPSSRGRADSGSRQPRLRR